MSIEEIRILIYFLLTLFLCLYTMYYMNTNFIKIKLRKINNKNQINFLRLQKQYLNNTSNEDIEDLIVYLYKYLIERKSKK